jgi:hypothetical protein
MAKGSTRLNSGSKRFISETRKPNAVLAHGPGNDRPENDRPERSQRPGAVEKLCKRLIPSVIEQYQKIFTRSNAQSGSEILGKRYRSEGSGAVATTSQEAGEANHRFTPDASDPRDGRQPLVVVRGAVVRSFRRSIDRSAAWGRVGQRP